MAMPAWHPCSMHCTIAHLKQHHSDLRPLCGAPARLRLSMRELASEGLVRPATHHGAIQTIPLGHVPPLFPPCY
jgi:hypothetical protein